jgi:hypothetical protein
MATAYEALVASALGVSAISTAGLAARGLEELVEG